MQVFVKAELNAKSELQNRDEERLLLELQRDENAALVRRKKMFPKTFLLALDCLSALLMNALTFSFQSLVHRIALASVTQQKIPLSTEKTFQT